MSARQPGKVLIVCVSTEHGNTRTVAEAIAAELDAELLAPDRVAVATLADYDLVGFGSGILPQRSKKLLAPRLACVGDSIRT